MSSIKEIIILGSGPAGLTAAIYCARAQLNPVVIAGDIIGGMLTKTNNVENFPGFKNITDGYYIMSELLSQAERLGAKIINNKVIAVNFDNNIKKLILDNDNEIYSKSIIIATGTKPRKLNIISEKKYFLKGLSHCAVCDGFFFKNQSVIVIGGGDSAICDSIYLSKIVNNVTIICRKRELSANKTLVKQLNNYSNIKIIWNSEVIDFIGVDYIEGVKIQNIGTNDKLIISCQGCFLALGGIPNTDIFIDKIDMDSDGYFLLKVDNSTNISGIFVAGDCVDRRYKQAIVAAAMGCQAAMNAEKWLRN